jgi:hypothetical protein
MNTSHHGDTAKKREKQKQKCIALLFAVSPCRRGESLSGFSGSGVSA